MTFPLNSETRRALQERLRYYNDLGIYNFYRRTPATEFTTMKPDRMEPAANPATPGTDPSDDLRMIREDIGDCTRCRLHKQRRKQSVFGVGNPRADLMFISGGPGARE